MLYARGRNCGLNIRNVDGVKRSEASAEPIDAFYLDGEKLGQVENQASM